MAQRIEVHLQDDVDQGPADETLEFGLDGVGYVIDLSSTNAERLRSSLSPWVSHARRVKGQRGGGRAPSSSLKTVGTNAPAIRAWAAAQGMQVSSRGRVPAEVRQAYAAAH